VADNQYQVVDNLPDQRAQARVDHKLLEEQVLPVVRHTAELRMLAGPLAVLDIRHMQDLVVLLVGMRLLPLVALQEQSWHHLQSRMLVLHICSSSSFPLHLNAARQLEEGVMWHSGSLVVGAVHCIVVAVHKDLGLVADILRILLGEPP
jgi:hypothetical protein